jgi:hypothetical protein
MVKQDLNYDSFSISQSLQARNLRAFWLGNASSESHEVAIKCWLGLQASESLT